MIRRAIVNRETVTPVAEERPEDRVQAIWKQRAGRTGRGTPSASFNGRRVLTLESRRSPELALLVMNYGGVPFVAPSLREVPIESNTQVIEFADDLINQRFGMVVLMTGVGVRMMLKIVDPVHGRESFVGALARTRLAARGPKPVAALREIGLVPWITAPSPNTWHELLSTLDSKRDEVPLTNVRLALQEYGLPNPDLVSALTARGAEVVSVPVYRWSMPDDVAPLRRAVWAIVRHEIDMVILTAGIQLVHLLRVAAEMNLESTVRHALERHVVVASVGPMTSEELQRHGLPIDFEPSHPKMGFLVKEVAEASDTLLQAKRCIHAVK
jgi:uroporphyrinogen-III synthase